MYMYIDCSIWIPRDIWKKLCPPYSSSSNLGLADILGNWRILFSYNGHLFGHITSSMRRQREKFEDIKGR